MALTLELVRTPTREARELLSALDEALAGLYAADQRHGLSLDEIFRENIRFFVARLDGAAVGCGGVALFEDFAEVKRMFTRGDARGRGVATAVLRRIEAEARACGVPVLRFETGAHQAEAIALYERMGFGRRGPFGAYAAMPARAIELSVFLEKLL